MNAIAAFRSPLSGQITTGRTHFEAFAASDVPTIDAITEDELLDSEGFLDGSEFLTRDQCLERYGFGCC